MLGPCPAQTRNYTTDKQAGRQLARADVPFLFKAFESGQAPPPRPGTKKAEEPRAATIHEYLDWTVTSNDAEQVRLSGTTVSGHMCIAAEEPTP